MKMWFLIGMTVACLAVSLTSCDGFKLHRGAFQNTQPKDEYRFYIGDNEHFECAVTNYRRGGHIDGVLCNAIHLESNRTIRCDMGGNTFVQEYIFPTFRRRDIGTYLCRTVEDLKENATVTFRVFGLDPVKVSVNTSTGNVLPTSHFRNSPFGQVVYVRPRLGIARTNDIHATCETLGKKMPHKIEWSTGDGIVQKVNSNRSLNLVLSSSSFPVTGSTFTCAIDYGAISENKSVTFVPGEDTEIHLVQFLSQPYSHSYNAIAMNASVYSLKWVVAGTPPLTFKIRYSLGSKSGYLPHGAHASTHNAWNLTMNLPYGGHARFTWSPPEFPWCAGVLDGKVLLVDEKIKTKRGPFIKLVFANPWYKHTNGSQDRVQHTVRLLDATQDVSDKSFGCDPRAVVTTGPPTLASDTSLLPNESETTTSSSSQYTFSFENESDINSPLSETQYTPFVSNDLEESETTSPQGGSTISMAIVYGSATAVAIIVFGSVVAILSLKFYRASLKKKKRKKEHAPDSESRFTKYESLSNSSQPVTRDNVDVDSEDSGSVSAFIPSQTLTAGIPNSAATLMHPGRFQSFLTKPQIVPDLDQLSDFLVDKQQVRISEQVGQGAFGVVHRGMVENLLPGEKFTEVALKWPKDDSELSCALEINKEVLALKDLGRKAHPNVMSMLGVCFMHSTPVIILEYAARGSLLTLLRDQRGKSERARVQLRRMGSIDDGYSSPVPRRRRLSSFSTLPCTEDIMKPAKMYGFGRQIARGMEFLTGRQIIHRDLAARNILVCADLTLKVSDFGHSRTVEESGGIYQRTSTKHIPVKWHAIESLQKGIYTASSDVWSFGVVLWEIATLGCVPYPDMDVSSLYASLISGHRLEKPKICPDDLYDMMTQCWDSSPAQRPTFVELVERLDDLLEYEAKVTGTTYLDLGGSSLSNSSSEDESDGSNDSETEDKKPEEPPKTIKPNSAEKQIHMQLPTVEEVSCGTDL